MSMAMTDNPVVLTLYLVLEPVPMVAVEVLVTHRAIGDEGAKYQ